MKTVKEWFAQLPEPHKTQCLEAALYYDAIDDMRESLAIAIAMSIMSWPGLDIKDLIKRANSGEFDNPAIPWPDEAKWENAHESVIARYVSAKGEVFLLVTRFLKGNVYTAHDLVATIPDMTGIDWKTSLETRPR